MAEWCAALLQQLARAERLFCVVMPLKRYEWPEIVARERELRKRINVDTSERIMAACSSSVLMSVFAPTLLCFGFRPRVDHFRCLNVVSVARTLCGHFQVG